MTKRNEPRYEEAFAMIRHGAWDEGYQIGLGDGLHGTRNVNPYRGEES